mmetsp:Transcript_13300/g.28874  ORF Transcript_13300/g.28874 Transcript_13300/m.28874 type:complete len:206 (-) Transcript_13300:610-1227(-)
MASRAARSTRDDSNRTMNTNRLASARNRALLAAATACHASAPFPPSSDKISASRCSIEYNKCLFASSPLRSMRQIISSVSSTRSRSASRSRRSTTYLASTLLDASRNASTRCTRLNNTSNIVKMRSDSRASIPRRSRDTFAITASAEWHSSDGSRGSEFVHATRARLSERSVEILNERSTDGASLNDVCNLALRAGSIVEGSRTS